MDIAAYGRYTIQSCLEKDKGPGYIHVPGARIDEGIAITCWAWDNSGRNMDHFTWMLVPVEDARDTFYLVSLRSGLPLRVHGTSLSQGVAPKCSEPELQAQAAQWLLEATGQDTFTMANQLTGHRLSFKDWKTANGTPLACSETANAADQDHLGYQFRFKKVGASKLTLARPAPAKNVRFPALKNIHTELPLQTEPVLREIEAIPFLAVTDPTYPPHRQVAISPYYTLGRSTVWRKVFDRQLDGIVERETEESTETGLTTFDAQTVASTLSWSVSTEAKVGYKGFGCSASLKVSARLAGETQRTQQSSEERRQAHMFTETILYPAVGRPYRLAKWRPVDRYDLARMDGSLVASWDVVRTEEEVIDVFPRTAKVVERKMTTGESDREARSQARAKVAAGT